MKIGDFCRIKDQPESQDIALQFVPPIRDEIAG
jgi:hypothetical protein